MPICYNGIICFADITYIKKVLSLAGSKYTSK